MQTSGAVRGSVFLARCKQQASIVSSKGISLFSDDANPFLRSYSQSRQNPLYNSDSDASDDEPDKSPDAGSPIYNGIGNTGSTTSDPDASDSFNDLCSYEDAIESLVRNTPFDSVQQTVAVKRDTTDLENIDSTANSHVTNNSEGITEEVDFCMADGKVKIIIKVSCEKAIPTHSRVERTFKKSTVVVSREIRIDLTVTPERRRLYNVIQKLSGTSRYENKYTF